MKNLLGLLKSFQEIQKVIANIQGDLKKETAEVMSGGGLVKIIVNGNQEVVKIDISPELITMKDKSLLEDLILSAVNESRKRAQEIAQEKVKQVTGGVDIGLT